MRAVKSSLTRSSMNTLRLPYKCADAKIAKNPQKVPHLAIFFKVRRSECCSSVNAIGRRLVQVVNSTACYMLLRWIDSLHCWANLSRQVTRFYKEIFCECDHSTDERSETRKHQSNTSFNILMNMLLVDFRVAKGCEISLLWRYLIEKSLSPRLHVEPQMKLIRPQDCSKVQ